MTLRNPASSMEQGRRNSSVAEYFSRKRFSSLPLLYFLELRFMLITTHDSIGAFPNSASPLIASFISFLSLSNKKETRSYIFCIWHPIKTVLWQPTETAAALLQNTVARSRGDFSDISLNNSAIWWKIPLSIF